MNPTPTPADLRAADLLQREGALLLIKSIERRWNLPPAATNKEERRLLHVLRLRPDIAEQVRQLLTVTGNETA